MEERNLRDKKSISELYNNVLPALGKLIHKNIEPVIPLFESFVLERLLDTWTRDPATDSSEEISIEKGNVQQLGLKLRLEGFNKPGAEPFDITKSLIFKLDYSSYSVSPDKHNSWLEKEYLQRWETPEYEMIAERWSEEVIDAVMQKLQG